MEGLLYTEILVEKHFVRCWIIFLFFKSRTLCLHLDPMLRIRITLIWIWIRIRPFTLIWIRFRLLIALNRQQIFNNSCSILYLLCGFISGLEAELFHPLFQRAT